MSNLMVEIMSSFL